MRFSHHFCMYVCMYVCTFVFIAAHIALYLLSRVVVGQRELHGHMAQQGRASGKSCKQIGTDGKRANVRSLPNATRYTWQLSKLPRMQPGARLPPLAHHDSQIRRDHGDALSQAPSATAAVSTYDGNIYY